MTNAKQFNLALWGVALLSLIPRLLFALGQYVEYDGYWHVWIAQQDNWANFLREYQSNAHPPLYFLLLRLSFAFGRSPLAYRLVSLLAGTASVYLVGRTAFKAMRSPVWALVAALAYGLALPSIMLSNEVRTYMLSAFLVQVSFYYFLDLSTLRSRFLFALMATLACLTEYYALFYVGAVLLASLVVNRRTLLKEAVTFLLIFALPAWECITHFSEGIIAYQHLPMFYFQPDSPESVAAFLWRALQREVNLFLPWQLSGDLTIILIAAMAISAMAIIVILRNRVATLLVAIPLLMMVAMMAASALRLYPFGGLLRQQYVLFPFLIVWPFLLLDRLPVKAGLVAAAMIALLVTAVSAQSYHQLRKTRTLLFTSQTERYNHLFPTAGAVYIDEFDLPIFFSHHDDWKWQFDKAFSKTVDVFRVNKAPQSMAFFRDKNHWSVDLRDPELYAAIVQGMNAWHLPSMTIFAVSQSGSLGRTPMQTVAYRNRVAELAATNGLCVQTLDLENMDVYAEFRPGDRCTKP